LGIGATLVAPCGVMETADLTFSNRIELAVFTISGRGMIQSQLAAYAIDS
jgi:hypothetical protein